jgi:hypothetical protein
VLVTVGVLVLVTVGVDVFVGVGVGVTGIKQIVVQLYIDDEPTHELTPAGYGIFCTNVKL